MSNSSERLPEEFFDNLTEKQRALLEILVDTDGEYIRGVDIRQRMRDDYNMTVPDKPGALNGLLSGFTRRYSKSFRRELIPGRWVDNGRHHAEFKIGQTYEEEIRSHLK